MSTSLPVYVLLFQPVTWGHEGGRNGTPSGNTERRNIETGSGGQERPAAAIASYRSRWRTPWACTAASVL